MHGIDFFVMSVGSVGRLIVAPVLLALVPAIVQAQATAPSLILPDRVSRVTVSPPVADIGVAREITISGVWSGCVPADARISSGKGDQPVFRVVAQLVLPMTLVACPAAFLPYSVSTTYTPGFRGKLPLVVTNVDGEVLAESVIDTRANDDNRSAFNISGLWYDPASNGSGLTFVHSLFSDNKVFGTWYVYDATGKPRWYTIQNTAWEAQGRRLVGSLYATTAPANCPITFTACPAALGQISLVGRVRVTINDTNSIRVEALSTDGAVIFASDAIRAEI